MGGGLETSEEVNKLGVGISVGGGRKNAVKCKIVLL